MHEAADYSVLFLTSILLLSLDICSRLMMQAEGLGRLVYGN
jgi:hypothetical protein